MEAKRGPGRPRVTDRPVKDGNPKVQFRVLPERRAWIDSRGGDAFVKSILEEYWSRSMDAVTPEIIEEFKLHKVEAEGLGGGIKQAMIQLGAARGYAPTDDRCWPQYKYAQIGALNYEFDGILEAAGFNCHLMIFCYKPQDIRFGLFREGEGGPAFTGRYFKKQFVHWKPEDGD